jgi:hypothetical protein
MKAKYSNIILILALLLTFGCSTRPTYSPTVPDANKGAFDEVDYVPDNRPQTVLLGRYVHMDGTDVYDIKNESYFWTIKSKPEESDAIIDDPNSPTPSFFADAQGDYVIELVVTDEDGNARPPAILKIGTSPPYWNTDDVTPEEMIEIILASIIGIVLLGALLL